jgi:hypothetical protein
VWTELLSLQNNQHNPKDFQMSKASRRMKQMQRRPVAKPVKEMWGGLLSIYATKGKPGVVDAYNKWFDPAPYDIEMVYIVNAIVYQGTLEGAGVTQGQADRFLEACQMIDKKLGCDPGVNPTTQPVMSQGAIAAMRDSDQYKTLRLNLMNIYVTEGKRVIAEYFNGLLYRTDGLEQSADVLLERIFKASFEALCAGENSAAFRHYAVVTKKLDKALGRA